MFVVEFANHNNSQEYDSVLCT